MATIKLEPQQAEGGGSGTSDFEELSNRPKYDGSLMDHNTDIPNLDNIIDGEDGIIIEPIL